MPTEICDYLIDNHMKWYVCRSRVLSNADSGLGKFLTLYYRPINCRWLFLFIVRLGYCLFYIFPVFTFSSLMTDATFLLIDTRSRFKLYLGIWKISHILNLPKRLESFYYFLFRLYASGFRITYVSPYSYLFPKSYRRRQDCCIQYLLSYSVLWLILCIISGVECYSFWSNV